MSIMVAWSVDKKIGGLSQELDDFKAKNKHTDDFLIFKRTVGVTDLPKE